MFRSVPVLGYEYFAKNVAEQCDIQGVAGFMQDSRSQSLSFIPKTYRYYNPCTKYIWIN